MAGSCSFSMSCAFLQLGFAITFPEADSAEKGSIAAAAFDKPSCVAAGAGWLGLAAITANQISTFWGTDRKAHTAGRTGRHSAAAQFHMLTAIPVATVSSSHVQQTPTAPRASLS